MADLMALWTKKGRDDDGDSGCCERGERPKSASRTEGGDGTARAPAQNPDDDAQLSVSSSPNASLQLQVSDSRAAAAGLSLRTGKESGLSRVSSSSSSSS